MSVRENVGSPSLSLIMNLATNHNFFFLKERAITWNLHLFLSLGGPFFFNIKLGQTFKNGTIC